MGGSIGVWDPEDGTVREFDEQFGCGDFGPNSRSRRIIEAMRLLTEVYQLFEDHDIKVTDERQVRAATRQALLDLFRRHEDE